jgi:cysteine desulfuration protein SufE
MMSLQARNESEQKSGPVESAFESQRRLAEEFELFDDWSDRYQTLIELGRRLASMPHALKTERNRIHNCRGDTWLAGDVSGGILQLSAASDTGVMAGLLAILVEVYSGRPASNVFDHPLSILDAVGLTGRLSPHRLAALREIVDRLQQLAAGVSGRCSSRVSNG